MRLRRDGALIVKDINRFQSEGEELHGELYAILQIITGRGEYGRAPVLTWGQVYTSSPSDKLANRIKKSFSRTNKWGKRIERLLRNSFNGGDLIDGFVFPVYSGISSGAYLDGVIESAIKVVVEKCDYLDLIKDNLREVMSTEEAVISKTQEVEAMPEKRDVFVVHGHDKAAQQEVARFLERLQFNPIILSEQTNEGRTIIEKFEAHAERAAFAVILLTPDDVGGVKGTPPDQLRPRARQNVIFELGFFVAKLSRKNVVALKKGPGLEILSDFSGVIYINMEGDGWQLPLAREMRQAGLSVDFNLL